MADQDASKALREAATKAGMSPEKFVQLSGKTTLREYEEIVAAEKQAEGGGRRAQ
jgi:vacuolar-type H+-ATPase subunit H